MPKKESRALIRRAQIIPRLAGVTLAVLLLGQSASSWAGVLAQLQRDTVQDGETVNLRIETDEAQSARQPDLTPLNKDFTVLGTSTSNETRIVNGNRSDKTTWQVRLQPRRVGTLEIPPIAVGNERTAAISLTVRAVSAQAKQAIAKHVFVETDSATPGQSIYVQQQIPYTVRLFHDDTIMSGELSAPTSSDAVIEQLGEETHYKATRNGREYNVVERRYAIAPEKSGMLHIAPAGFHGTAASAVDVSGAVDPADNLMARMLRNTPFANDPAFMRQLGGGMAFGNAGEPVATRGQDITLQIKPRPAQAQGTWLPAEQIVLHDSWQDGLPAFKVGEPATRTITVQAKGLAASQIAPLSLAAPATARLYREAPDNQSQTDGKTIFGSSKQVVTYIPNAQGGLDIAPVTLAWWNTLTNTQEHATLAGFTAQVAPGVMPAPSNTNTASAGNAVSAKPAVTSTRSDSRSSIDILRDNGRWSAAALALVLATVASGLWWNRMRRRRSTTSVPPHGAEARPSVSKRAVLRALQQACDGNRADAAAKALLELGRVEWPDNPPRGLGALAARLGAGDAEVLALERHLYGGSTATRWDGPALWRVTGHGLQVRKSTRPRAQEGLDALYHR